ncbi:phage virion morphogenesis protein [Psychromonas aquimarina]|uniref:phage virion morphogenesis protein n=1 Tax=Psychromonas aquimarina TaxID=444919 RepID=UPI0003F73FEC|nr:phage virion morphogenesis protein [Psychromonas aquimarina]
MEIKTPEQLTALLKSLELDDKAKFEINRQLANHTRRFFRTQVRAQRDVDGKSYAPRKRRKVSIDNQGKAKTKRNMLMGMSRNLKTEVSADAFSVGLVGLEGHIAKIHNEGKSVVYTRRINGFFNSKTNSWEGGRKQKAAYQMPKRTMVGWTPELQRQIAQIILSEMKPK